ncbi:uroporphyrinogen decarboxylase family protein [Chloroflexota bacterium]
MPEWTEMTPEEKREERYKSWLTTPDTVNAEVARLYQQRVQRIIDALSLKKPDKVPVFIQFGFIPAMYAGYTHAEVMRDYQKMHLAWLKFIQDYDFSDLDTFHAGIDLGKVLEILDYKMYKWAGHGAPDNSISQYVENEYMSADEYDYWLDDPSDYHFRVYMPRVMGALSAFRKLPPFSAIGGPFIFNLAAYGNPEVQAAFNALVEAGNEINRFRNVAISVNEKALELGLSSHYAPIGTTPPEAPFDAIGNHRRGTIGIMTDMYRRPDKLLEVLEKVTQRMIKQIPQTVIPGASPIVFMGLHRGADGFMSEQQFTTFYWPFLRRIALAFVDEGYMPCLFAEGGYNSRLEIVNDFPKGKVMWHFDRTDMVRAKQILGDSACIAGNVPTSLLVTGKPAYVKEYCRKLIEDVGRDGGFILAPGAGSNDARLENLFAVAQAATEFGKY